MTNSKPRVRRSASQAKPRPVKTAPAVRKRALPVRTDTRHNEVAQVRARKGDDKALVVRQEALPRLSPKPPKECRNKAERELYKQIVSSQAGTGVFRVSDKWAVLNVVQHLAMAELVRKELAAPLVKGSPAKDKQVKSALRHWRALVKEARAALQDLGMSPASRQRFCRERSETLRNTKIAGYGFDFHKGIED